MDLLPNIFIILLAALIHASLQLGPGCLLLLCRHSLSTPKLRKSTTTLTVGFILGAVFITTTLLAAACYFLFIIFQQNQPPLVVTAIASGVVVGLAGVLPFIYYRPTGTALWIPRTTANFLESRTAKTSNPTESFSLGIMSVLGEAPITLVLIAIASYSILELTTSWQLLTIVIYAIIATIPLTSTALALRFGSNISRIQRWRESNKTFFRIILAVGFFTLGAYIFVFKGLPVGI
ncbi:hypothetical protein FWD07_02655 [Candidatus Saccharibacteria bacterium]|nr:hypothetical protein [Candidatus Saccharibacteria bacterium]